MYHIWRPKSYYRREQYMAIGDADPDARSFPLSADEIQTLQHLLQRVQNSGNSKHSFNLCFLYLVLIELSFHKWWWSPFKSLVSINMNLCIRHISQSIMKKKILTENKTFIDTHMYTVQMYLNISNMRKIKKIKWELFVGPSCMYMYHFLHLVPESNDGGGSGNQFNRNQATRARPDSSTMVQILCSKCLTLLALTLIT